MKFHQILWRWLAGISHLRYTPTKMLEMVNYQYIIFLYMCNQVMLNHAVLEQMKWWCNPKSSWTLNLVNAIQSISSAASMQRRCAATMINLCQCWRVDVIATPLCTSSFTFIMMLVRVSSNTRVCNCRNNKTKIRKGYRQPSFGLISFDDVRPLMLSRCRCASICVPVKSADCQHFLLLNCILLVAVVLRGIDW